MLVVNQWEQRDSSLHNRAFPSVWKKPCNLQNAVLVDLLVSQVRFRQLLRRKLSAHLTKL
jgi:hypothetical protein